MDCEEAGDGVDMSPSSCQVQRCPPLVVPVQQRPLAQQQLHHPRVAWGRGEQGRICYLGGAGDDIVLGERELQYVYLEGREEDDLWMLWRRSGWSP